MLEKCHKRCVRVGHSPGFESIHFFSAGSRRRERPGPVPFVLIGCSWYDGRRLPPPPLPAAAAAPPHRQLLPPPVRPEALQGLVAVGHVHEAGVVVMGRGVDAAVVGPPLVEMVWVRFGWVAKATPRTPFTCRPPVEPALVAVSAGGVAGQSVAAGVARVLSLAL